MQTARATSILRNANAAVNVTARRRAQNAVKERLRAQGVRLTLVPPREINTQAQQYLADHPELYDVAIDRAQRMGIIDQSTRAILEERRRQHSEILVTPDWFLTERNS